MSGRLCLRNRQRLRSIDLPLLRRIISALLEDLLPTRHFDLAIHLVRAPEITRLNETFLHHEGATDVITFDYTEQEQLHGEIFICIDDAVKQARQFRTTWQSELVRYLTHGVLHTVGYDDLTPADRCVMKREENRLLRMLSRQFCLRHLANAGPPPARKAKIAIRKS